MPRKIKHTTVLPHVDIQDLHEGVQVRFLPPPRKAAYDAGLEGKVGIVLGEPWGRCVRVQVDDRAWLTSPERLELAPPSEHPDVMKGSV
jgi:hypothetical protein